MKKSAPLNITLPGDLPATVTETFLDPIEKDAFFGRQSLSMVIRALLEIAIEQSKTYDTSSVQDYESLKTELKRTLRARK